MSKKTSANIKIVANTKEAAEGINRVSGQLDKLSKEANSKLSTFSKLGSVVSGVQAAFSLASGAIKGVSSAVNEVIEAYKTQATAETLLETAVRNNPYLRDESAERLKSFASELQKIGTVGDETLIPMMAQLASAGRSEQEIMDIMSASLDVAASGTMSLESAVRNLNKTYSGMAGELGEAMPQVKNLTKEQLKSGDAVKVVADAYKGMAEKVTQQVGGAKQLKNAWGDFLEVLGKPINAILNPIQIGFASFISKITGFVQTAQDKWNSLLKMVSGESKSHEKPEINYIVNSDDIDEAQKKVDALKKRLEDLKKSVAGAGVATGDEARKAAERVLSVSEAYQQLAKNVERGRKANELLGKVLEKTGEDGKVTAEIWKSLSGEEKAVLEMNYIKKGDSASKVRQVMSQNEALVKNSLNAMEEAISTIVNHGVKGAAQSLEGNFNKINDELIDAELDLEAKREKLAKQEKEARDKEAAEKKAAREAELSHITEYGQKLTEQVRANAESQRQAMADGMQETFDYSSYLSVIKSSYQQLLSESGTLAFDESKAAAKSFLKEIIALYKKTLAEQSDLEKDPAAAREAYEALSKEMEELAGNTKLPAGQLKKLAKAAISQAETQLALLDPQTEGYQKLADAIEAAKNQMKKFGETTELTWESMDAMKKTEWVVSEMNTLASGVSDALSLTSETMQNQTDADLSKLESAYKRGEISEEEYYAKKEQIEKEGAKKKYKVELANWATNLLMTQSSAALAIAKCFEQGPILGPISAAVMGIATAAQLAAQIAAKPVPPSFASGGIVQGNSYSGDNVRANVNSGEMILNARQQRALWEAANGNAKSGGAVFNIRVNNEAGDVASAGVVTSADGFTVAIKKIVSDAMAGGELNDSYQTMRANIYGRRITS